MTARMTRMTARMTVETVYKITRPDLTTCNGFQWQVGRWIKFPGTGDLCGPGWAHFYLSPQLAVLLNPIHAHYEPFMLWRAEGIIGKRNHTLKVGCSRARLLDYPIVVPPIPVEARITFALWCALAVYQEVGFRKWAEGWLSGTNRTRAVAGLKAWAAAERTPAAAGLEAWAAVEAALAVTVMERAAVERSAAWTAEAAAEAANLNLVSLAHTALLPWDPD